MENLTIPETILRHDMVEYLLKNSFSVREGHSIEKIDYKFSKEYMTIELFEDHMKCEKDGETVFYGYVPEFLRGFQELMMCIGFVRHKVFSIPENPEDRINKMCKAFELNIRVWENIMQQEAMKDALQYSLSQAKAETGKKLYDQFKEINKI